MDNKTCFNCGTENLPDYRFCKKCGVPLNTNEQAGGYAQQSYQPQPIYTETIDGVATADVAAFVGKAAPTYIPKFCQMELNRSKISFNWLFALIAALVTPFFAPCWFIHKKMYKIGFALFGVLAFFMLLDVGIFLGVIDSIYSEMFKNGIESLNAMTDSEMYGAIMEHMFSSPWYTVRTLFSNFLRLVYTAIGILGGLFANWLYKNHAVKTIKSIVAVDENDYKNQVVSRGGTKNSVWITVVAVFLVLFFVISFIGIFAVAFNAVMNMNMNMTI